VLLPDGHGILFSNGYYLESGTLKVFESTLTDMRFERKIAAPNGEDFLYVFYNQESGDYVLLSYNLIAQRVETPISCNGYSLFRNGALVYFKADHEPKKTHALQLWQTPYVHPDHHAAQAAAKEGQLFKIGNKDLVRGMAEAQEVLGLVQREQVYASLYFELSKKAAAVLDAHYWINDQAAHDLGGALRQIKEAAGAAIDEFEKVTRVRRSTEERFQQVSQTATALVRELERKIFQQVGEFVDALGKLRQSRGEAVSLKELRYIDLPAVEALEAKLAEKADRLSQQCVEFLLRPDALDPYGQRVDERAAQVEAVAKVVEADEAGEAIDHTAKELELLIDVVSNLKIADATQTTQIIERISEVYARLNALKAKLKARRRELLGTEAVAEFNAQLKLMNQAVANYLDVADTPERCEEYMTKLMVQLEELEGRFSEFDEFAVALAEKRDEVYNAFESRKLYLLEQRNKRTASLMSAAERILKGIKSRLAGFDEIAAINAYFASDLMVDKVRGIIKQLSDLDDSVKADDLQSQLKTLKEDALRQLKDRKELFVDGSQAIKFGKHQFSVNVQELEASIVLKDGRQYYHLSGTGFFELVEDDALEACRPVWEQALVSESAAVYRAEYLAYQCLLAQAQLPGPGTDWQALVRQFAAPRYQEGYVKGVHDRDAAAILEALCALQGSIGLLRFRAEARACAAAFWHRFSDEAQRDALRRRIHGEALVRQVFPDAEAPTALLADLEALLSRYCLDHGHFGAALAEEASRYLFAQLSEGEHFAISPEASELHGLFGKHLAAKKAEKSFSGSLERLAEMPGEQYRLVRGWVGAFLAGTSPALPEGADPKEYADELAVLLLAGTYRADAVVKASPRKTLEGMAGEHAVLEQGRYRLDYNAFMRRLGAYEAHTVPLFRQCAERKRLLVEQFRKRVKLESFKPRVLSSFVRNRLIDEVYLPLIGDNLAKQIGVVGEQKRTDLMGMLLLVSPPGYGKTTLMEYVASRLGLIFMKINGPAIGHQVTSLDPAEAPNASAREEMNKLNLAFEMGDNVMIYVDDIQHCHPEFLQKFISLCDGQRKIEGVYRGESKTYDLRGRKVCVVMAGNPYTESGDKFQIPDMLANRADTYNLGDILGDSREAFELSYIENAITSNPTLATLSGKPRHDLLMLVRLAKGGSREGISFESNIAADELQAYVQVLQKMLRLQQAILQVNQQYIASAAQADEYRTEPSFKLQGSYRNMNKLAEKVVPIMNDEELDTLLLSHYESEAQTLTSGAEANLLKFRMMCGFASTDDQVRWEDIVRTFRKHQQLRGVGGEGNPLAQVVAQMGQFTEGLEAIRRALEQGLKG
jgi:hypothetical protein